MSFITGLSDSAKAALAAILSKATEFSVATGDATDGSTTTLKDTTAVWETDKWKDAIVEITHVADGKHYYPTITGNTADTLTFGALAITVAAGDHYEIRMTLRLADIDKWGGTELTGRDISLDLKALVDDTIKGILRSIGDAGEAENLLERIGEVQASPTANTVLDRLKDIETAIGTLTPAADTPVIYNVTMTLADTQYSQALPANTKKYTIQTRDGTAFRMAFETGKVAAPTEPYFSIGTDGFHHEDSINPAALTLYFACGEAAKVVEIIVWS